MEKSTPASEAKSTEADEKNERELNEQAHALRNLAAKVLIHRESLAVKQIQKEDKKDTFWRRWIKKFFP